MKIRVGQGYDVHQWVINRPFLLGGVLIPSDKGPLGHSDADIVCHVLCDALLGAANMRNIGFHFSDKDPSMSGIASTILLQKVMGMIRDAGWELGNADVTVILDQPKLNVYIPRIKENLSQVMGVGVDQLSLKATTSEGMGFVGRGEGISAMAVALIQKD